MANLCIEAANLLKFCMACSDGLTYLWEQVLQMLVVMQVKGEYTLGQWRGLLAVGIWWLGQWQWGSVSRELVEG